MIIVAVHALELTQYDKEKSDGIKMKQVGRLLYFDWVIFQLYQFQKNRFFIFFHSWDDPWFQSCTYVLYYNCTIILALRGFQT